VKRSHLAGQDPARPNRAAPAAVETEARPPRPDGWGGLELAGLGALLRLDICPEWQYTIGMRPLKFIGEPIQVQFDTEPALKKKPGCPDRFVWSEGTCRVAAAYRAIDATA
jgi:hypothetical protein